MWPIDLPAAEVLKPPGETVIPWAIFDADWYRTAYREADAVAPEALLRFYLDTGQKLGHSPNRLFDEAWHRSAYPSVNERIASGEFRSAFDAYCRRGLLDRSPHWLFDELGYRDRYPDLTDEILAKSDLANRYDHYLRHGVPEDRIGHVLFDPKTYRANFDAADAATIRAQGTFTHYLERIGSGAPEIPTSPYFDPAWYLNRYPAVAREIEAGRWLSALHHYLCNDSPAGFDPSAWFSEEWYIRRDPGLKDVIARGHFRNAYMHFLKFGAQEKRPPSPAIDLAWYAAQAPVRSDLEAGRAPDAFSHWLTIGRAAGLPPAPPEDVKLGDTRARMMWGRFATALLPLAGRFGFSFQCVGEPAVSIVMPLGDNLAVAIQTIAAVRAATASAVELILLDRGSDTAIRSIAAYITGAKILRFETDIGWARAADAGRQLASAPLVLFLSDDAKPMPGSIDRACARMADTSVGAVGGLILQPHGVIARAGGIVWNDGGTHDYKRDASALAPEANFVRDTDFCGDGFLLTRRALVEQLDGFDHDCRPGYELVDYCLRLAAVGTRVVYDPSVVIIQDNPIRLLDGCGEHFARKHAAALASRFAPGGPVQVYARHAGPRPHRVLFIDDSVPLRRAGSGFVRANDLVREIAGLGYAVTVFPVNGCDADPAHIYSDMPETVEVMYDQSADTLAGFLEARALYYDTIWLSRIHNLVRIRPILTRAGADGLLKARIILDTEAVTPCREAVQTRLAGEAYDFDAAMGTIVSSAQICAHVVAVTDREADILQQRGMPSVSVVGHMVEPRPTARPFAQRAGMLFVGAIHQDDSPNLDSLIWFVEAVLPLVEAELKWETRLTIAGYTAPGIDLSRFEHHPRVTLRGAVPDLTALYNSHRIFVAPTRYAAGAPYKVLEAASRGLPVMASELLLGQLGWTDGVEIVAADTASAERFATKLVGLYRRADVWQTIRDGALARLSRDFGQDEFSLAIASVLDPTAGRRP